MTRGCQVFSTAVHTALGASVDRSLAALSLPPSAAPCISLECGGQPVQLPYRLLADMPLDGGDNRLLDAVERTAQSALSQAGLTPSERHRCGLMVGSSSFDIGVTEQRFRRALGVQPDAIAMTTGNSVGSLASDLRQRLGLHGQCLSFSTACTGSANALCYADALVRSQRLDHVLVLGVECLNLTTALGFHSLQLLSRTAMRPFTSSHDGIVLGESCAAVVLGPETPGSFSWRLLGSANRCDTHGISVVNPDGSSVSATIHQALTKSHVGAADICAIKVHGTATAANDESELTGMRRVFPVLPPLLALKPHVGHTLGASGLTELVLFCAAVEQRRRTCCSVSPPGEACMLPARGVFLLNQFGFGGNNTSLVLANFGPQL